MPKPKKHVSFGSLIQSFRLYCEQLPDERQTSKVRYPLVDIVLSAFACMFFQDCSLLQFQRRMEDNEQRSNVSTLFGLKRIPEDTQLREVMDAIPTHSLQGFFSDCFAQLQRGKHLEQFRFIDDKYLVSVDGTQYFTSQEISCEHCLTKHHKQGEITYSHQALQAAMVHPRLRQVIPMRAEDIRNEDGQQKQDCEINAAKRLICGLQNQ